MPYTFKIDGETYISLKNNIYFNKDDKEFAIFLYDINEDFLQAIIGNKKKIKINITPGKIISHFILDTGVLKFAFELFDEPEIDIIRKMIENKSLEIGIAFKKNDVLLEDLCFTIDY